MKKITILFFTIIALSTTIKAQQSINVNGGVNFSTFAFKNDLNDEKWPTSLKAGSQFSVGYQYDIDSLIPLMVNVGVLTQGGYGDINNQLAEYNQQNLSFRIRGGYYFLKGRIKPMILAGFNINYLMSATQLYNGSMYNLKELEAYNNLDVSLNITPGLKVSVTDQFDFNVMIGFDLGVNNIETDEQQKTYTRNLFFETGFSIKL